MRGFFHYLLQQRVWLLLIFGAVIILQLVWFGWWGLLSLLALEAILLLLLRFTYGRNYRYSLYNYFLIDHPLYGNYFRPNISAPDIDFLICDKYVFRHGVTPSLNLTENKKQRVRFSINSRGFRGPEFSPRKQSGVFRIFCLGGSTTAGNSVNDNETWPVFLEQFLRTKGQKVEVINAGVQGWYSYQDLLRFTREIVDYEPDLVLISQGWNDEFIYSSQNLGRSWSPRVARHFMEEKYLFIPPNRWLANSRFLLFHLLMRAYFKNFRFDRRMAFTNPRRWQCLKQSDYLIAWFDTLVDFARAAAARGIELRTINAPVLIPFEELTTETSLKSRYLAVSQKRIQKVLTIASSFIPVIDAAKVFHQLPAARRAGFFQDDFHPSVLGNKLLAETVGEALLKREPAMVAPANLKLESWRQEAGTNDPNLDQFIDGLTRSLRQWRRDGSA